MKEYLESSERVLESLSSGSEGLSDEEAAKRLEENGRNKLREEKKVSLLSRFLAELADPMIIILLAAAAISAVTSFYARETPYDVFIILIVVLINAVLGVVQESKAEKAVEALQTLSAATSKVLRGGRHMVVKSEELVTGDIVILEAGDAVPADLRIIECASMKTDEAALTGESVPVTTQAGTLAPGANGDVPLAERKNMAYMGSSVVYGRGRAVVAAAGMDTEMGKIADAISKSKDDLSPLQQKLNQLSKVLTFLVLGICAVIFAVNLIRAYLAGAVTFDTLLDTFMVAVSLAVAAIPEGLAAVVTIVLSMGVTKMAKKNAIIRKLTAVETLGCTQIICSDKTGTLTQNRMTVVEHRGDDETLLAPSFALCSDAELNDKGIAEGDPTQNAVVNYAYSLGMPKHELEEAYPRVGEITFDSVRKLMTTVHSCPDGAYIQHTTGAPDVVISRCDRYFSKGRILPIGDGDRARFLADNKALADKALRVLAAAYADRPEAPADGDYDSPETMESGLIYLGLVGMIDPVREEVPAAIEECRRAGIRPILITGDHKDTAVAIAKQLGIIASADEALTGAELDAIPDEVFKDSVRQYSVYARVQPEHKTRIVNAWKALGMVTAMTGDGVNDAPSIKSADIGVGMGITGTDVTKNVADMVLADDNFATILSAVSEGRRIYSNIRKAIQFLLSSNMSEVITIFTATLMGFTILKAPHLLWINLITDCLPALSLGMEPAEHDIMTEPPRSGRDGIFSGGVGGDIVYQGILVSILTLAAYFLGIGPLYDPACGTAEMQGMTMAFLTMSMAEIFHSFNLRSRVHSIFALKTHNLYLFGAMVLSLILTAAVIEIPAGATMFGFAVIDLVEYLTAMVLAILVIPVVELVKLFQRSAAKRKGQ